MFHVKHSDFVVYVIRLNSATYPHIPAPRNGKSQRSFLQKISLPTHALPSCSQVFTKYSLGVELRDIFFSLCRYVLLLADWQLLILFLSLFNLITLAFVKHLLIVLYLNHKHFERSVLYEKNYKLPIHHSLNNQYCICFSK